MESRRVVFWLGSSAAVASVAFAAVPLATALRGPSSFYTQHNLVSDGFVAADVLDSNLVNPWGIAFNPKGVWWVSDNATSLSTLYDQNGTVNSLVVDVPGAGSPGAPTGIVFNPTSDFVVSDGTNQGPAAFLFASEDGTISGWNPSVPPPPPSKHAHVAVDDSGSGAVYKGLALATTPKGNFLYATDFHNNKVDVYDGQFAEVDTQGGFVDPDLPAGFAPFGIAVIQGKVYVTYAMQDDEGHDNVNGEGLGYVDVYETGGHGLKRLVSGGRLNAPWGLALAPSNFGLYSGKLLVGNFGSGQIDAYDLANGRERGVLKDASGHPIEIEGLWGIGFGNGKSAGPTNTLFFAAGVDDEAHGLFGRIDSTP